MKEKLNRMDDIGSTCYDIKPENAVLKTKKKEDGTEIIEDVRLIDWDGDFCLKKNYTNKDNNKIKGNRLFNLLLMANHFYDIKHSFGIKHNIFINHNQKDLTLTQGHLDELKTDKIKYCSNFYYINRIKQYFRDLPKSDDISDYCKDDMSNKDDMSKVFDIMIQRLECNIIKPKTKPETKSCPKPPSNLNPFAKRPTKPKRPKKSYEELQNTGKVNEMTKLFQGGNKTKSKRNKKNKTNKKRQTFDVYCK